MEALSYEEKKRAVIAEITAAFDGVELGDGTSFHEAFIVDDYRIEDRTHALRREAHAKDIETRWQDVPDELIRNLGSQVLNFLDARGFHYYVPAFLVWYLCYMDSEDMDFHSNTFDSINYQLLGGFEDKISESYLVSFSVLSPAQSQAVAHFLEFMIVREDKIEAEDEAERQDELARGGMTEEQIQKWRDASRESRVMHDYAGRALKRHWGQFLSAAT